MSTESAPSAPAPASIEPVVGSAQYARLHMDADTKAVVAELIGESLMAQFLASDSDKGDHNRADFSYETTTFPERFSFIFADMLIAAAPQAAQRTLSVTSLVQPSLEISETAAATATLIDKMCPYEAHAAKRLANANEYENGGDDRADKVDKVDKDDVDEANVEIFVYQLWNVFMHVIRAVPYDSPLQYELLGFLQSLQAKSRGPVEAWGGKFCPLLPQHQNKAKESSVETTVTLTRALTDVSSHRSVIFGPIYLYMAPFPERIGYVSSGFCCLSIPLWRVSIPIFLLTFKGPVKLTLPFNLSFRLYQRQVYR